MKAYYRHRKMYQQKHKNDRRGYLYQTNREQKPKAYAALPPDSPYWKGSSGCIFMDAMDVYISYN